MAALAAVAAAVGWAAAAAGWVAKGAGWVAREAAGPASGWEGWAVQGGGLGQAGLVQEAAMAAMASC